MSHQSVNDHAPAAVQQRAFGVCLAIAGALMVFGMLHHPAAHGDSPDAFLKSLADLGPLGALVHGGLIVIMVAVIAGLGGFSLALGAGRLFTTLGFANYLFGSIAMLAAAMINGFALSDFAAHYADATAAEAESLIPILTMASAVSGIAAKIGTLLWSIGVTFWSVELAQRAGANRIVGALGAIAGLGTIIMLLSDRLTLDVHGFLGVVIVQALWLIAVSVQLIRRAI